MTHHLDDDEILPAGPLVFDLGARTLSGPAGARPLGRGLFPILLALVRRLGCVVTVEALITACWPNPDDEPGNAPAAIRSRMMRLREEIRLVGADPSVLRVSFGVGYALGERSDNAESATRRPPDPTRLNEPSEARAA